MLIEVNPFVRNMLASLLTAEGYPVLTCADDREAATILPLYPNRIRALVYCASPGETASAERVRTFWPAGPVLVLPVAACHWYRSQDLNLPDFVAEEVRRLIQQLEETP